MEKFFPALLISSLLWSGFASGEPQYNAALVLARARDRVLNLAQRLPRYTCIQTVNRTYLGGMKKRDPGASCDQLAGDKKRGHGKLILEATDRLRLDVIVTEGHEIYSWAGATHFDLRYSGDLEFIGGGPVGTGPFGTFLLDIFSNEGTQFEFLDSTELRGKAVLEYAYQVPLEASHYLTSNKNRDWRATAFHGSLWVNPGTGELGRITVLTSELAYETGACTAETRVDYQSVRLGTGEFLLPLESELHFLLRDGTESNSMATYSNCREYVAKSSLSFVEPAVAGKPEVDLAAVPSFPDGLRVFLATTAPIDTRIAAAGDAIAARVEKAVLDPKSQAILIPVAALVHGRIVRMEHRLFPAPHFLISISWAKIEDQHTVAPFFARIDQVDLQQANHRAQNLSTRVTVWLPPPGESKRAGGWFILPTSKDYYVVPAGFATEWLTASQ